MLKRVHAFCVLSASTYLMSHLAPSFVSASCIFIDRLTKEERHLDETQTLHAQRRILLLGASRVVPLDGLASDGFESPL